MAGWIPRCFKTGLCVSNKTPTHLLELSHIFQSYNLLFFLLTYITPMLGMALCYYQMGHHLWKGDKTILQLVMIPQAAMAKSRTDKKRVSIIISTILKYNFDLLYRL
jgi:hypothetical protein